MDCFLGIERPECEADTCI